MNIQLLLSANPSQGSDAPASQATGAQGISNGLFRQAMLQANEGQPRLSHEVTSRTAPATSDAALNEFASLLESLGIELNQEALAQLFAQLQMAEQPSAEQLAALPGAISSSSDLLRPALDSIPRKSTTASVFSDSASQALTTVSKNSSVTHASEHLTIIKQGAVASIDSWKNSVNSQLYALEAEPDTMTASNNTSSINLISQLYSLGSETDQPVPLPLFVHSEITEQLLSDQVVAMNNAPNTLPSALSDASGQSSLATTSTEAPLQTTVFSPEIMASFTIAEQLAISQQDALKLLSTWTNSVANQSNALQVEAMAAFNTLTPSDLSSQLKSLNIELNQETLAQLFAQLQMAEQSSAEELATLPEAISNTSETPLSALDEISSRLSLVAAFTGTSTLQISNTAETTSIAAIAEQLAISQQDAVALVGAYQQLTGNAGQQGSPQRLETLNQQLASLLHGNQAVNAATDSQPSASSTLTPSSQTLVSNAPNVRISSDAMAGALVVSGSSGETAARLGSGNDLAFNLPNANGTPAVAAATGTAPTSSIGTPVSHPAWPSQLGQQLVHVAQRGGEQHIQLKLHPAELGPLSISLKMTEHGAQAQFLSAHAQVRQVIEQAIPQLREALAEQGISLGDTSVGEQNASNEQTFAQQNTGTASLGEGNGLEGETEAPVEGVPVALDGRVDLYA
ncbi:flagellar hook-length control protein FliK [Vreelandella lutescens]|uniref:Flagellar hook-length control protein-like C-terminal domain-containing protein n=1 Tax=Vreelandella lutescens TaxID=1602943 RepID=A0ABQ1PFS9_9GAMM|nr:flagellar hook-length control protein FliK [Halomonas lutescens]GGC96283.1 hypothetical protein GCM10011382_28480 [Halomonas lutescens]